jgi:hypothetical protein
MFVQIRAEASRKFQSLKLPQESFLILIQVPDVIDLVPQHGYAIHADAEGEALMLRGVQAAHAQHFRTHHAAAQHFNPARSGA